MNGFLTALVRRVPRVGPAALGLLLVASSACLDKPPPAEEEQSTGWPGGHVCEEDGQCASGACVQYLSGEACAATCTGDCPAGLACKRAKRRDPASAGICVPPSANLCRDCANDEACGPYGDLCLPMGAGTRSYCALDCSASGLCPEGFTCENVSSGAGDLVARQCLPKGGTCSCEAANAGARRPCVKAVLDLGACFGEEVCDAVEGWIGCNAPTPQPELCDGKDNDCDNAIDEDVLHTPDHCSSCNDACPPVIAGDLSTERTCTRSGETYTCGLKCRVPFFDVNGEASDGCEVEDDYTADGSGDPVLNNNESVALVLGGLSPLGYLSEHYLCGLRLPTDAREHVPRAPPNPNVDFYLLSTGATAFAPHVCVYAVGHQPADVDTGLKVCVSVALDNANVSPLFNEENCATIQGSNVPLVDFTLPPGSNSQQYYYVRVQADVGAFAGVYSVMAYDGGGCTLGVEASPGDPCGGSY